MINNLEEIEIIEEEIIETDYTNKTLKLKKKLLRKIKVVFVSSIIILITSIIDKHDDFDIVLKSNLFIYLLYLTIAYSFVILVFNYTTKDNLESKKVYRRHKGIFEIFELLSIVPIFMVILTVSNVFVISPSFIDGASMEPNYYDGEDILFWHFNVDYERLDVVILQSPNGSYWIKRIIGLPGDTIVLDQGKVYVNTVLIDQEFLRNEDGSIDDGTYCRTGDPDYCTFVVLEDEYFVLGDNRSVSDDSRSTHLNNVSIDQLFGKVVFKFDNFLRN